MFPQIIGDEVLDSPQTNDINSGTIQSIAPKTEGIHYETALTDLNLRPYL
jgi:hypothetical protein